MFFDLFLSEVSSIWQIVTVSADKLYRKKSLGYGYGGYAGYGLGVGYVRRAVLAPVVRPVVARVGYYGRGLYSRGLYGAGSKYTYIQREGNVNIQFYFWYHYMLFVLISASPVLQTNLTSPHSV